MRPLSVTFRQQGIVALNTAINSVPFCIRTPFEFHYVCIPCNLITKATCYECMIPFYPWWPYLNHACQIRVSIVHQIIFDERLAIWEGGYWTCVRYQLPWSRMRNHRSASLFNVTTYENNWWSTRRERRCCEAQSVCCVNQRRALACFSIFTLSSWRCKMAYWLFGLISCMSLNHHAQSTARRAAWVNAKRS